MPVGTQATVKACTIDDIKKTGSESIISDPVFFISSIVQALTVACVPTGINAGVLISPL